MDSLPESNRPKELKGLKESQEPNGLNRPDRPNNLKASQAPNGLNRPNNLKASKASQESNKSDDVQKESAASAEVSEVDAWGRKQKAERAMKRREVTIRHTTAPNTSNKTGSSSGTGSASELSSAPNATPQD